MVQVYFVSSDLVSKSSSSNREASLLKAVEKRGISCKMVTWEDPEVIWSECDLCIIRTPHDYFMYLPKFLKWTRKIEKHTTLWNPSNVIEWNSTKKYLIKLQEADVPVPPTIFIPHKSKAKLTELLKDVDWKELILKPANSAGAWGTKRCSRDSPDAQTHLDNLLINGYEHINVRNGSVWNLESGDALIQKFITEIMTEGESSLIYFGGKYSHAVKKVPALGDFRVHDTYGGQVHRYEASLDERRVAEMGLEALGMETQYARIDTVLSKGGPLIIEMELIEPRMFFEYYPETAESYVDHIENYLKR